MELIASRNEFTANCSWPVAYSLNQMMAPVDTHSPASVYHILLVKGFRAMNFEFFRPGFTVTTICSPDSIYGWVNEAY